MRNRNENGEKTMKKVKNFQTAVSALAEAMHFRNPDTVDEIRYRVTSGLRSGDVKMSESQRQIFNNLTQAALSLMD